MVRRAGTSAEGVTVGEHANITVKTKIVVNGTEYGSVDELPAELRAAYEKALSAAGGGGSSHVVSRRITVRAPQESSVGIQRLDGLRNANLANKGLASTPLSEDLGILSRPDTVKKALTVVVAAAALLIVLYLLYVL